MSSPITPLCYLICTMDKPDRPIAERGPQHERDEPVNDDIHSDDPTDRRPAITDRLVMPETREEMFRGQRIHASPADPPHAERHIQTDAVVFNHTEPGYIGATDMLTRVSEGSDFATDTAVRKRGIDPKTGVRYLEELAFEVVHTQRKGDITARAAELIKVGVRRVFAIFAKRNEVAEWSRETNDWVVLPADGAIEDPCLVRPLEVRALFDIHEAENASVRAFEAKGNPQLQAIETVVHDAAVELGMRKGRKAGRQAGLAEGEARGRQAGLRQALLLLIDAQGIALSKDERIRVETCTDPASLQRWLRGAARAKRAADIFC